MSDLHIQRKVFIQQYLMPTLGLSQQWEQAFRSKLQNPGSGAWQADDTLFKCWPSSTLSVAVWLDIVMSYRPGMPVMFSLVFLGCSTMTHYFIKKDHILGKVEMKETSCFYASSVCYNKKKSERFVWVLLPISNLWCFAEEFVFVIGSQKVY